MAGIHSKGDFTNKYIEAEELAIAHIDSLIFKAEENGDNDIAEALKQAWSERVKDLDAYISNLNNIKLIKNPDWTDEEYKVQKTLCEKGKCEGHVSYVRDNRIYHLPKGMTLHVINSSMTIYN